MKMETKIINGVERVKTKKGHWIDSSNIQLYNRLRNIKEQDIKDLVERSKNGVRKTFDF